MIQFLLDLFRGNLGSRSGQWPAIRKQFLKDNIACAVCGTKGSFLKPNEVHHIKPFNLRPELELEENNLITLCRDHHFFIAHLMSWSSWNENVKQDSIIWNNKIKNRPKVVN